MAFKGHTTKPCEGCGTTDGRPIGQVCRRCRELLAEAALARAAAAAKQAVIPMSVPADASWPSFTLPVREGGHVAYEQRLDQRLERALQAVCRGLWEVIPDDVAHERMPVDPTSRHGWRLSVPDLLAVDYQSSYRHRRASALIDPAAADAVRQLDAVLRETFAAIYRSGVEQGTNLLGQLATGQVSADDFNKKTVLGDAGATVRRQFREE